MSMANAGHFDRNNLNGTISNSIIIEPPQYTAFEASIQHSLIAAGKDLCVVCGIKAHGTHFGVTACAACAAFFRRSISEQKSYKCLNKKMNCTIIHGFDKGRFCRHCRFKKCSAAGMQPEKVQSKRRFEDNVTTTLPTVLSTVKGYSGVNDSVYKYSILQQQRKNCYTAGRPLHDEANCNKFATMENYHKIITSEPKMIFNFLNSSDSFDDLTDWDKMAVFKNYYIASRIAEQARFATLYCEHSADCFHLVDGTAIRASESGLTHFYGSGKSTSGSLVLMDPIFIARMSLPNATFHVSKLIPAFRRMNVNDREFAVLLNLVLWDTAIPELSRQGRQVVKNKRQQVIKDLCAYYKAAHMDIPIRFANLILLLNPIQEDAQMWREMLQIIALMKAEKSTYHELQSNFQLIDQL